MSWFPVDDAFHSHPKAQKAGDEALGMWTRAGSHCMAYLTDGFVAEWWVKQQARGTVKARRLVVADLWHRGVNDDGEDGFWFHDWKPECMKEHVLAAREKARQRKAKSRESHRESQQESRVTGSVSPPSCLVPTQPNPTQPINPLVDSGGGVTQVGPAGRRPECSRHAENSGDKCRDCMCRREWDEAQAAAMERNQLEEKRRERDARQAAIDGCLLCDEFGEITFDDSARKCSHEEAAHA